jgi:hypothetical protein
MKKLWNFRYAVKYPSAFSEGTLLRINRSLIVVYCNNQLCTFGCNTELIKNAIDKVIKNGPLRNLSIIDDVIYELGKELSEAKVVEQAEEGAGEGAGAGAEAGATKAAIDRRPVKSRGKSENDKDRERILEKFLHSLGIRAREDLPFDQELSFESLMAKFKTLGAGAAEGGGARAPSNQNGGYNHKLQKYQNKLRLLLN